MSDDVDLALRIFLPCYFVAYIAIGYVSTVASFKKKYGFDPRTVAKPDPVMELGESYRNIIFAVALLIVFAYAVHPPLLTYLGPIPFIAAPVVRLIGAVVLVGALVLVRLSQRQLKSSWRVGVDLAGVPADLITTGVYARSRNPIYVGMTATAVGLFVVLPNAVTFAIACVTFVLLQIRTRVEEQYLLNVHGEAYAAYCRTTARWLFRVFSKADGSS